MPLPIKKTAALVLTLLYLSTALGLGLQVHYCFGQVASVKLYASAPSCQFIKRTRLPDCCKSKHINLKIKDSHQLSGNLVKAKYAVTLLPAPRFANSGYPPQWALRPTRVNRGPPGRLLSACPAFIKNCTIRI